MLRLHQPRASIISRPSLQVSGGYHRPGAPLSEQQLFTVGHSNHSIERFMELLRQHDIEVIVDVRSNPASSRNPQFNRESLKASLGEAGIKYLFLGKELGARRSEREA